MKKFLTILSLLPAVFFVGVFLVATAYFILTGQSFMYDPQQARWGVLLLMMFLSSLGGIGLASFINS